MFYLIHLCFILFYFFFFFFFNDTATTEIYTSVHTLSLHDALPISPCERCKIDGKPRQAKWLLRGAQQRAARGREPVHGPGVHAVHGRRLAAAPREVADQEARGGGVEGEREEHAPARAAHREAARRPGGAGRPGRVRLLGRREPRSDDGPQSLEVARDRARIRNAAVQDPRLRPSRERVALLAAGHVYALDAVGLKRGDPLVAPVVHASPPVHELGQAPAPQIHVGVAGAAHVDARVDRAPRAHDELQQRPAAATQAEPATRGAVHPESHERRRVLGDE